jgi:hypothetical protein
MVLAMAVGMAVGTVMGMKAMLWELKIKLTMIAVLK